MTNFNHEACDHPSTTAARTECRRMTAQASRLQELENRIVNIDKLVDALQIERREVQAEISSMLPPFD